MHIIDSLISLKCYNFKNMNVFNRSVLDIQNLIHQIHKTSDPEPFKNQNINAVG